MAGLESNTCRTRAGLMAMLALPCLGWGQVSLQPDTTTLQWGERVQLTANWLLTLEELNSGVADSAAWPAWTDTTAGGLEVLAQSDLDTLPSPVGASGDVVLQKSWLVTSWDSGFVVVPPVAFGPHTTQPFMLEVVTPNLEPEAQPQPAQGIVVFEWTLWEQIARHLALVGWDAAGPRPRFRRMEMGTASRGRLGRRQLPAHRTRRLQGLPMRWRWKRWIG